MAVLAGPGAAGVLLVDEAEPSSTCLPVETRT